MLKDLQKRIFQNKVKQGFNTSSDYQGINQGICCLVEELGELARHHRRGEIIKVVDSVIDLLVYTLGLLEIIGVDGDAEIDKVLKEIGKREYMQESDGTLKRIK